MEAFYSAVVNDAHGQHLFYVGELDEAAAERTFLQAKPEFQSAAVAYRQIDGSEGVALDMRPSMVLPWVAGMPVGIDVQEGRIIG